MVYRFRHPTEDPTILAQQAKAGFKQPPNYYNDMLKQITNTNTKEQLLKGEMGLYQVAKDITGLQDKVGDALNEAIEVQTGFTDARIDPSVNPQSKTVINNMLPTISKAVKSLDGINKEITQQQMGAKAAEGYVQAI